MSELNDRVIALLKYLIETGQDEKPEIKRLLHRYNWQTMIENPSNNITRTTSYMEDKGKTFAICLRDKDDKFHSINTLMFVTTHELAHLMTEDYGHTPEFWRNFKYLLEEAIMAGLF